MSGGTSSDSSSNSSTVWGGQSPFLEGLYQQGADLYSTFQPQTQIPGQAQQVWNQQLTQSPQMNPYLSDMTQVFKDELGYANQASGGEAGLTGGYGGGRHGVADYLNAQAYQSNVGNFLGGQYQADMDRAQYGIQNALGLTDQMMSYDPYQQRMGALQQQGQLLGAPTILGEGSSSGSSMNFGGK